MPDDPGPWLATCDIGECDWSHIAPREDFCTVIMAIHVLVKHPDKYHEITGKDPQEQMVQYRDYVDAVKNLI